MVVKINLWLLFSYFKKFLKLDRINVFLNLLYIEFFNTILKKKGSFDQFSVSRKTMAPKLKCHCRHEVQRVRVFESHFGAAFGIFFRRKIIRHYLCDSTAN